MLYRQRLCYLTAGLMMVTGLSSCTLTPPSSETIIFQQPVKNSSKKSFPVPAFPPQDQTPASNFLIPYITNLFFSTTFRPAVNGELEFAKDTFASFIDDEFEKNPNLTEDDLSIRNTNYLSIALPIPLKRKKNVYWSINVGVPVLGTDATVRLAPRTYLTANAGFLDGELIAQQKILQSKKVGIAVGGFYRAERRGFEIAGNETSLNPFVPIFDALSADRIFYNHIVGGRVQGYVPMGQNSYIHLRLAPGYALNLREPVLNFSLTLWLDFL